MRGTRVTIRVTTPWDLRGSSGVRTTATRLSLAPRPMRPWGARAPGPLSEDDERVPTSCSGV